jgi:ketosteroid isomerase-like protein
MTEAATARANAAMIGSAYDAFSRGDVDGAFAVFAEDILWHIPGRAPPSGDYCGHDEVLRFLQHFMELSCGTFRVRVDGILAKAGMVIVLCTETAQRGDRSWVSAQIHVWRVRDGHAAMFLRYPGYQRAEDEFWSAPAKGHPPAASLSRGFESRPRGYPRRNANPGDARKKSDS